MHKIIIITGQTAVGKTKLALQLAATQNGEVVNFDARQIYKNLNITTGKDINVTSFVQTNTVTNFSIGYYNEKIDNTSVRVWLYDIVDPKQHFSAFDYQTCALTVISDIIQRKKTPILVGGSYFYLYYLLYQN